MKRKKIKIGIIGASGYTGTELIRLLVSHPYADLKFALSKTYNNKKISDIFPDLIGETDLFF
jgi:N-acetyl-gamma-glutamyl-phosphate reductase